MRACGRRCSQLRKEPSDQGGYGCLTVVSEVMEGTLRVQATNSCPGFEVTTDGTGVVGHAGAALLRELADRLELTRAFGWREPGERRRHPDAAVLRDLAVTLADGGDCLSDLAVCGTSRSCSGRSPRPRPPGGSSSGSGRTPTVWPGCAPPGPMLAPARGLPAPTRTPSC